MKTLAVAVVACALGLLPCGCGRAPSASVTHGATQRSVPSQGPPRVTLRADCPPVGAPASNPSALHFVAVFRDGNRWCFRVEDAATHKGEWLGLNDPSGPWIARGFDPATDTLVLEVAGKSVTLALRAPAVQVQNAVAVAASTDYATLPPHDGDYPPLVRH